MAPPARHWSADAGNSVTSLTVSDDLIWLEAAMHQRRSFDDFDDREPGRNSTRRRWILPSCLSALVLIFSAGFGFGLSRGFWAIPDSARNHLPRLIAEWLSPAEPPSPSAQLNNYAFELTETKARQGDAVLSVRLVHKPTDKFVSHAVIFARRLDMAPEGMPTMTADLEPLPNSESGAYRFKTNLTMRGKWQLSLAAKIQGERGTVQNRLVIEATP